MTPLPARFPCLCQALYSWSGEEDDDLGFVEGDVIECLHPGDGQWWFGRLRRNKVVGNFPSNFVTIISETPTKAVETGFSPRSTSRNNASSTVYGNNVYKEISYVPNYDSITTSEDEDTVDDAPAPMPPPHTVLYRAKSSMSMYGPDDDNSPVKRSQTPSRTVMDDVMKNLYNSGSPNLLGLDRRPATQMTYRECEYEEPISPTLNYKATGLARRLTLIRPKSSLGIGGRGVDDDHDVIARSAKTEDSLHRRRSIFRIKSLSRSNTNKTSSTSSNSVFSASSNSTVPTTISDMSATSAGSLARRKAISRLSNNDNHEGSSEIPVILPPAVRTGHQPLQGKSSFSALKLKKSGFFNKIKTLGSSPSGGKSTTSFQISEPNGITRGKGTSYSAAELPNVPNDSLLPRGSQSTNWIQVQTDMHRAHSMSQNERAERRRKQELEGYSVLNPLAVISKQVEGDEGADGNLVENGMDVSKFNFATLDKAVRALSIPSLATLSSFTITVLCRPYKSDLQRLRAIFIFCTERIIWQQAPPVDEYDEPSYDVARIFRSKKASSDELANCVKSMCDLLQIPCEVVTGYLRAPGEIVDSQTSRVNHAWNAVAVDGEWRMVDASLASPTHPRRSLYSNCPSSAAEDFYFLARPSEILFTHIPRYKPQQHIIPKLSAELLLDLPSICPATFKYNIFLSDFDTSLLRTSGADVIQIDVQAPTNVDCIADIEVRGYCVDADGDLMESGEVLKCPALSQPFWVQGKRTFRIKTLLPKDESTGVLKIYAGRRGLLQSVRDNPYPLAIAVPVWHSGPSKPFSFVTRIPTPPALRYDVYIVKPQCRDMVFGNMYMFDIRQFPNNVEAPTYSPTKQAKLALQSPSGKITRLTPKDDILEYGTQSVSWEGVISCHEAGVWRGLITADRSSSWCIFAEWNCVR
ncbi:hypothetical protein V1525DRAFT_370961 [Lipomyces kononenkoae]|uniref:Uncharacterized protein n=1 Tax=Lipomyces kononenkoae TaxID=34357 RepID=A0ACC3T8M0_LIPKO